MISVKIFNQLTNITLIEDKKKIETGVGLYLISLQEREVSRYPLHIA